MILWEFSEWRVGIPKSLGVNLPSNFWHTKIYHSNVLKHVLQWSVDWEGPREVWWCYLMNFITLSQVEFGSWGANYGGFFFWFRHTF